MSHGEPEFVGEKGQRPARSKRLIAWSLLLFVAFLIYEVTARPAFGIVILCSKFGWDNFLTAYWLRRVDQNRSRGRACFWYLLASGFIKVLYAAFGLCTVSLVLSAAWQPPQGPQPFPPMEFFVALGVLGAGSLLSLLTALLGLWSAYRAGLRIWLAYPPFFTRAIDRMGNCAELLPGLVAGFLCLGWIFLFCLVGSMIDPQPRGIMALIFPCVLVITYIPICILAFKLFFALKRQLIADQPGECWEPDLMGEIMVSQMPNWKRWRRLAAIPRSPN
jgi:hypothetical protein